MTIYFVIQEGLKSFSVMSFHPTRAIADAKAKEWSEKTAGTYHVAEIAASYQDGKIG